MSTKINTGDFVAYDGYMHDVAPNFYPAAGTFGYVEGVSPIGSGAVVQWTVGSTSGDDLWWCGTRHLVVVETMTPDKQIRLNQAINVIKEYCESRSCEACPLQENRVCHDGSVANWTEVKENAETL